MLRSEASFCNQTDAEISVAPEPRPYNQRNCDTHLYHSFGVTAKIEIAENEVRCQPIQAVLVESKSTRNWYALAHEKTAISIARMPTQMPCRIPLERVDQRAPSDLAIDGRRLLAGR